MAAGKAALATQWAPPAAPARCGFAKVGSTPARASPTAESCRRHCAAGRAIDVDALRCLSLQDTLCFEFARCAGSNTMHSLDITAVFHFVEMSCTFCCSGLSARHATWDLPLVDAARAGTFRHVRV